jgi:hypothetical protein
MNFDVFLLLRKHGTFSAIFVFAVAPFKLQLWHFICSCDIAIAVFSFVCTTPTQNLQLCYWNSSCANEISSSYAFAFVCGEGQTKSHACVLSTEQEFSFRIEASAQTMTKESSKQVSVDLNKEKSTRVPPPILLKLALRSTKPLAFPHWESTAGPLQN